MNIRVPLALARAIAACGVCVATLRAQPTGTMAQDRARLAQITGDSAQLAPLPGVPLSTLPGVSRLLRDSAVTLTLVRPELRSVWNSALPYGGNDGALWAGRGWNQSVTGGFAVRAPLRRATFHARVAPTLYYSQNRPFQIYASADPARSGYANPFHEAASGASLDLPHRFGDRHLLGIDLGRSRVAVEWPEVSIGVTAENEWWGPGIRNAIVMSNNAAGVPRWFIRTTRPVRTRLGALDASLLAGTLTQSLFFSEAANEHRTLSGLRLQFVPAFDSTLSVGFTRVVYAPVGPEASPFTLTLARSLDALARWENLAGPGNQRSDQIGSVFARWIFPQGGFEVYGEWARMDLPRSATELLTAPHHTGGWTFGFQWAQRRTDHRYLRLQAELTYLEQSRVFPDRPSPDFYSGMASPQGYTQRGQVIGAAIGPGASSQWVALDWMPPRWQLGAFIGRIRWDNDAMYRWTAPTFWKHDVSMLAGVRGGWRTPLTDVTAELTLARRYNYLFQNGIASPGGYRTVDVNNVTLALAVTPR